MLVLILMVDGDGDRVAGRERQVLDSEIGFPGEDKKMRTVRMGKIRCY